MLKACLAHESNTFIEGCSHKIRRQIEDLEGVSGILSSSLTVDGVPVDTYLTKLLGDTDVVMYWNGLNFKQSLPSICGNTSVLGDSQSLLIVDGIHVQMEKIDDDLKESEIMCNSVSHPVRGTRRLGGEIGFSYEADWQRFSRRIIFAGLLLQTPSLHDHDQRDMFCFDQRDIFVSYLILP
ncbi:hypothetical protein Tco_1299257, partial [Tanacetum coccineum]